MRIFTFEFLPPFLPACLFLYYDWHVISDDNIIINKARKLITNLRACLLTFLIFAFTPLLRIVNFGHIYFVITYMFCLPVYGLWCAYLRTLLLYFRSCLLHHKITFYLNGLEFN